jgi:hypothetical protein
MKILERRKTRRHSRKFDTLDSRDQFISKTFPQLTRARKPGYFIAPGGVKVSVWYTSVIWNEPLSEA